MASVYPKKVGGKIYYYLRQMARVDGKPRLDWEIYLGSADEIQAVFAGRDAALLPERTRHLAFGDVAAVWAILQRMNLVGIVDEVVGARRSDAGASVGTYLALATLNRVVDPCSKLGFADWWAKTAADRFVRVPAKALDHRRFWDAADTVTDAELVEIERRVALHVIKEFELDVSSVALDMTNFATYINSTNGRALIAQRGKAKQKRSDLRLAGLGMVFTRDRGVPILSHTYPGNKHDSTQFPLMIKELADRHAALSSDLAATGRVVPTMTVVFDSGQNSEDNFLLLDKLGLNFVGSIPPSDCPDLLALPATDRHPVNPDQYPDVTAIDTRRVAFGQNRRVVLTHSQELHDGQSRGLDQTLDKAQTRLSELADRLARGRTRRDRPAVEAEIASILHDSWAKRVLTWHLSGDTPTEHRLTWQVNPDARARLEEEIFGKHVLITSHDHTPVTEVVSDYRSQSEAEFGYRQLKDPRVVSFSPMHHWTDHTIRVHIQTMTFALMAAHLLRGEARHAGLDLSVRALLNELSGVQETVLIYPSTGGRPKARRMLTQTNPTQDKLITALHLTRWAPRT